MYVCKNCATLQHVIQTSVIQNSRNVFTIYLSNRDVLFCLYVEQVCLERADVVGQTKWETLDWTFRVRSYLHLVSAEHLVKVHIGPA